MDFCNLNFAGDQISLENLMRKALCRIFASESYIKSVATSKKLFYQHQISFIQIYEIKLVDFCNLNFAGTQISLENLMRKALCRIFASESYIKYVATSKNSKQAFIANLTRNFIPTLHYQSYAVSKSI